MKKRYVIVLVSLLGIIILFFYFKDKKVYTSEEYSSEGLLIGTTEYVYKKGNLVIHGKFIKYNTKKIKISEGNFINGEVEGKCIYY